MKRKLLILAITLTVLNVKAQFMGDIHTADLFQVGTGTALQAGGSKYKLAKTNHLMLNYTWQLPQDGMWFGFDGSYLVLATKNLIAKKPDPNSSSRLVNNFNGAAFTFDCGFMFNNKRPIGGGSIQTKIGMGMVFGAHGFEVDSASYVALVIGPEIGSFTSIGERINLFTKVSLPFATNKKYKGLKPCFEAKLTYKVTKRFGISVTPGYESYNINMPTETRNTRIDKAEFKYIQFGLSVIM